MVLKATLDYVPRMKWSSFKLANAVVAIAVCSLAVSALADRPNPYQTIIDRNVFALKPPPPPPDPAEQNVAPPAPLATVKLTGITSLFSKKKALLEITPAPGKPPVKPILEEGERSESVEVLSIDMDKNTVTIKNGTLLTNITFEVVKSPAPAAAPVPGLPGIPGRPIAPVPVPPAPAADTGFNTGSGRRGVSLSGGATPEPTITPAAPALPTAFPAGAEGFRSIPSRQVRTPQPQPQVQDPVGSYVAIETMRHTGTGPPMPPTPLSGVADNLSDQQTPYRGPPQLPRRGPPPIPGR